MINTVNRLALLLLIGIVTSSAAFAATIKKRITFSESVVVNGTLVKKGNYVASFDDQTNELTILKGREVIVKAPARLEKRDLPAKALFVFREEGGTRTLTTVAFKDNQATIVNGEGKSTSAQ